MARFSAASRELLKASEFDYVVFNEVERLSSAIEQIGAIIAAERLRTEQNEVSI
jgi:guanylate kinase